MKRSLSRGQTMVLMAISLLLLTLMVTLTLSIGAKVREKMEVQALADAAAYSNAAVTARVYNEIAVISRAQIGHMVSLAAVQSLISWSSVYRANVAAVAFSYGVIGSWHAATAAICCIPHSGCGAYCGCSKAAAKLAGKNSSLIMKLDQAQAMQFDSLDKAAGKQSLDIQNAAWRLHALQILEYERLKHEVKGQHMAQEIVDEARAGTPVQHELNAPSSGASVSSREIEYFTGAVTPIDILNSHHVFAAMGSRGFSMMTGRSGLSALIIQQRLQTLYVRPPDAVSVMNLGSTYFSTGPTHGAMFPLVNGEFAWSDDHGGNTLMFNTVAPPCFRYGLGVPTIGWLKSTSISDQSDMHLWSPFIYTRDKFPPQVVHTLGRCLRCPSMWPTFIDYNMLPLINAGDNYGQPKNFAVIQRDYGVRAASGQPVDPWNLAFRFRFSPERESGFDNRSLWLEDGTDISKQTGLSAGIAYYHRKGHWREPPNLLNPYWRATLVPLTVDDQGKGDVKDTLGRVDSDWAADAFSALRAQGYEGGP